MYTCLRTGLHSQIPARSLAIASVTNVTLVVTKSDTYNVINIRGATMGSIGGYVFTTLSQIIVGLLIIMIVQFIGKHRVNTWRDNPWQDEL